MNVHMCVRTVYMHFILIYCLQFLYYVCIYACARVTICLARYLRSAQLEAHHAQPTRPKGPPAQCGWVRCVGVGV